MPPTTGRLKRRTFEILQIPSAPGDAAGHAFDLFIMTLIVLNVLAVMAETVEGIQARYAEWLLAFEWLSLTVFATEFALRLWSITTDPRYAAPLRGRLRWMATPVAAVDLLAILPALLVFADLRFLRVVRLLRLLKLGRYSESLQVLTNVVRDRGQALLASLFIVGIALVLVSSFVYYAEHEAQPEAFPSIPAAMWWGVVTLTTTGYGDVVPVTVAGKMLGGVATLIGVGIIALPVGILASGFVEELERRRKIAHGGTCPHCGKDPLRPPP